MVSTSNPEQGVQPSSPLQIRFESAEAFRDEFHRNLGHGALFLPTLCAYSPSDRVEIQLDLAFCRASIALPCEVVAAVDERLAAVGDATPGVSVRVIEQPAELRRRLEAATGMQLGDRRQATQHERRRAVRVRSDSDVLIETPNGDYAGTTANVCFTGVLALIPVTAIPAGTAVRVHLSNPLVELALTVDGKIVHTRRCDGGVTAHGIQLRYPAERIDEVMAFIEFLQSFDRARRLAVVSGEIDRGGLGPILDLFVSTAPAGTLTVSNREQEGKIVFSENYILRSTLGMVTGMKALSRMFRWQSGRFEFHHELQLAGSEPDPQPVDAAMMIASVQLDEMARFADAFPLNESFRVSPERASAARGGLTEIEVEVLECAAEGFAVGAIADVISAPDSEIYKALAVLLDRGILERQR